MITEPKLSDVFISYRAKIRRVVSRIVHPEDIDDIVQGIILTLDYEDSLYEIVNLGNNSPVTLLELVETIEAVVGKKAFIKKLPNQIGDVPITYANINKAQGLIGYNPTKNLKEGIYLFYEWYKSTKL